MRITIVEDEEFMREELALILKKPDMRYGKSGISEIPVKKFYKVIRICCFWILCVGIHSIGSQLRRYFNPAG